MEKIYYDIKHPASYGGQQALRRALGKSNVKPFLYSSHTYGVYAPTRRRFPRRKIIALRRHEIWQSDLNFLANIKKYNKNMSYLLVCTDTLSKMSYIEPLKTKGTKDVQAAFLRIFKRAKVQPEKLLVDRGLEFISPAMKRFFNARNIHVYFTYSDVKASQAERLQRYLREKMSRIFNKTGSYKYLAWLPDLEYALNRRYHRSIKMRPIDVTDLNEKKVFHTLFGDKQENKTPRYVVGDRVRVQMNKGPFAKGYSQGWSDETFIVTRVDSEQYPVVYYLQDESKEPIKGMWYQEELQPYKRDDNMWMIEKVLRKRTKNGKTEYYVKWLGFDKRFNSWTDYIAE